MLKLKLVRAFKGEKYTIGRLYVNEKYYCDTLEDRVRNLPVDKKIMHETAIPEGTYDVRVTYSPRFKRNLPLLLGVPYFTGIRIHRGNTAGDTSGCILVGENKVKGMVINSTPYEENLTKLLTGNFAVIEII